MTKTQEKRDEQANAEKVLRETIKPGDTVFTILRHVSASGMSRSISLVVTRADGIFDITYFVARFLGDNLDQKRGGIKVGGCGMDMGFHLVYGLSRRLFPDGFVCPGKNCPSNDHFNKQECRRETFKGQKHTEDGGYALNHRWL